MARKQRTHLMDSATPSTLLPKHLTKQEFGRRLYNLMLSKGWTQSELSRRANLSRDRVSAYVRGLALPTPANVQALAESLDVTAEELLPNYTEAAIDEDSPAFDMKTSTAQPGRAWVRVNRLVTFSTGIKIAALLEADDVTSTGE